MELRHFDADLSAQLAEIINRRISNIPPVFRINTKQMLRTIENATGLFTKHYPELENENCSAQCLIACDGSRILAASAWLQTSSFQQPGSSVASVLFFVCEETCNQTKALALLQAIENSAKQASCKKIVFSRFAFGVGWFGLPSSWELERKVLLSSGFKQTETWLLYVLKERKSTKHQEENYQNLPKQNFRTHFDPRAGEIDIIAEDQTGETIGTCSIWDLPQHLQDSSELAHWTSIEWIEVAESIRGQGAGRLLLEKAIDTAKQTGKQNLVCWTESGNIAAQKLCSSSGFQLETEILVLEKELC